MRFAPLLFSLFFASVLLTTPSAQGVPGGPGHVARVGEQVEIVRDAHGVPHVFASTDRGAMYGAGYATAQDRLFQMCFYRLAIQGRQAEFLGDVGEASANTIEQDKEMRYSGYYRHSRSVFANLDSVTRGLLQAFADGVNAWIDEPSMVPHPLFTTHAIAIEPWTPADSIAVWIWTGRKFQSRPFGKAELLHDFEDLVAQFGLEEAIATMSPNPIHDDPAALVQLADVSPEWVEAVMQYAKEHGYSDGGLGYWGHDTAKFSHAFVVDGELSGTGAAILISDPQIKVTMPSHWHEIHVKGATFEARGLALVGHPGLLIGFNADVAWGVTALGADLADLFELAIDPADPDRYLLDGVSLPMTIVPETILVKGGAPVAIEYRETEWGPVVTPLVDDVQAQEQFAMLAIPIAEASRDTTQGLYAMMRASSATEFGAALEGYRFPSVNVVFGDAAGDIGYWARAAIPLRSSSSPLGGMIAQDGSSLEYDWQEIVPNEILPHVFDPGAGTLYSANHMPVGSWYPVPLGLGTGSTGDTDRSRRLRELLVGPPMLGPAGMLAVQADTVNPSRRDIVRIGAYIERLGVTLDPPASQAVAALSSWLAAGGPMTDADPNTLVAHFLQTQFRQNTAPDLVSIYGGGNAGLNLFLKTMIEGIENQPGFLPTQDEIDYIENSLARGWNSALNQGPQGTWSSWYTANVLSAEIPYFQVSSAVASLDPTTTLPVGPFSVTQGGTILSQRAQSYTQFVPLADLSGPLGAGSLLPPGSAEGPGGSWQSQVPLWETGALKSAFLRKEDVLAPGGTSTTRLLYLQIPLATR